jgi:hypothetical protein
MILLNYFCNKNWDKFLLYSYIKLLYLIVVEIKFQFAAYAVYLELYYRNYIMLKQFQKSNL